VRVNIVADEALDRALVTCREIPVVAAALERQALLGAGLLHLLATLEARLFAVAGSRQPLLAGGLGLFA